MMSQTPTRFYVQKVTSSQIELNVEMTGEAISANFSIADFLLCKI